MTVDAAKPSVFDAGLPTLQLRHHRHPAADLSSVPRGAAGGADRAGTDRARGTLVRARPDRAAAIHGSASRQGIHLSAHGITSGPLWDRVTRSILNMEGEEHRRLRSLVSRAFTPRATARMHDTIHTVVNELIDRVERLGPLRVRRRHRPPLPDSRHLRTARRAPRGLATVLTMGRRHLQDRQLRLQPRRGGTRRPEGVGRVRRLHRRHDRRPAQST